MALAREEERGGREKEGTPWPPRSGGAARRPEREAERERDPAMLTREDTKVYREAGDGRREPSDGESDGRK